MSLLVLIPVGLIYLVCVRILAGHFAWWQVEHWFTSQQKPDGFDWLTATVGALFWPIVLCVVLICTVAQCAPTIGAEKRHREHVRAAAHQERARAVGMPDE